MKLSKTGVRALEALRHVSARMSLMKWSNGDTPVARMIGSPAYDEWGRVPIRTAELLIRLGYVEPVHATKSTTYYTISDAGRTALAQVSAQPAEQEGG